MNSTFAWILLLAFQISAAPPIPRPTVPEKLVAPVGERVIFEAHAAGSQIYVCQAGPDQKLAWVFKAPEAELFDPRGAAVGKHFAGPTWKLKDGSEVVAKLTARQDSPDANSIPWLLLTASSHSGSGLLATVTSIQRIHTKDGQPPASGCDQAHIGTENKAGYSADYYFYAPAR